jgi:hypothetical protein
MLKKTFVTITCFMMIMIFTFNFLPVVMAAPVTIFEDDMEFGISNWTSDGLWHQTDDRYNSFNTSWVYNDGVDYDTGGRTFGNLTSSEIDLTTVESANLTFWTWHETEGNPNYDKMWIRISEDLGPFMEVYQIDPTDIGTWLHISLDISSHVGHVIQVAFFFDSLDEISNTNEGWYIDDFVVTGSTLEDHDIAIISLIAPEEATPDYEIFINGQVANIGLSDEINITVNFTVNGVVQNSTEIPILGIGNSTTVNFSWTPTSEGDFVVGIEAALVINENYTENNDMSKMILVRYSKGHVLFDQTHGCDDISNYDAFVNNLTAEKYNVSTFSGSTIDASTFSGIDVFVIPQTDNPYTPSELSAIENFVTSGGGLFVFGDGSASINSDLTGYANITWIGGGDWGPTNDIISHDITKDVLSVYLPWPIVARLQVTEDAEALVFDDSGHIMLAYSELPGRVIGFANENTFDDVNINKVYNLQLSMNIIKWLASGKSGHDILVNSIEIPKILSPGETTYINATVHNRGLFNEFNINIELTVNGTSVDTIQISSLESGHWTEVSFLWSESNVGIYEVGIKAIPVPFENMTSNNAQSSIIKVREILGYVLFDQTHYTDSIQDYSILIASLENDGFIVDIHESGAITSDIFQGYDVFVIPNPYSYYNIYEIAAIEDYVSVFGGLLVIGDRSSSWCEDLTEFSDIDWTNGGNIGTSISISSHEITSGVFSVDFIWPDLELRVYGDAKSLVRDSYGNHMLAVSEYPGRVAAFVDDQSFKDGGITQVDNLLLARNIIKWLAINPPAPPSNFTANLVPEGNALNISWNPNPESNIVGYVLYRRDRRFGDFFEVATVTAPNYKDSGLLNNVTYYYYVVAFDDESLYSPNSTIDSAMPDIDTDRDGIYDRRDDDDDDDGLLDNEEDKDRDGIVDFRETDPKNPDTDGDGANDGEDPLPLDPSQWLDKDGDGYGDNPLGNNSDAFPDESTQWSDTDGDGYGDNRRGNNPDAFPYEPTQWSDIDGDGYGDNVTGNNSDAFIDDSTQWSDSDGDGYGDNPEGNNPDEFPNDPGEWKDSDDDGVGDNSDFLPEFHNTSFFILMAIIAIICIVLLLVVVLIKKGKIKLPEKREPEPIPPSPEGYAYPGYTQPSDAPLPPYPPPPSEMGPYGPQPAFGGAPMPTPPPIPPPPPPAVETDITALLDDLLVTSEISEEDFLTLKEKHGTPEWQKTIDDMLVDGKITADTHSELNRN